MRKWYGPQWSALPCQSIFLTREISPSYFLLPFSLLSPLFSRYACDISSILRFNSALVDCSTVSSLYEFATLSRNCRMTLQFSCSTIQRFYCVIMSRICNSNRDSTIQRIPLLSITRYSLLLDSYDSTIRPFLRSTDRPGEPRLRFKMVKPLRYFPPGAFKCYLDTRSRFSIPTIPSNSRPMCRKSGPARGDTHRL